MIKSGKIDEKIFENPLFFEFYGALLGDGWIGKYFNKKYKKIHWVIGFSGHSVHDRDYLLNRIRKISQKLFFRKGHLKERPKNSIELIIGHKILIGLLNKNLNFPLGKKIDLKIHENFTDNWNLMKHIIRGLFDTDGSIYFDSDPRYRTPYPVVEICTIFGGLRDQLLVELNSQGFRVIKHKDGIRIKGRDQVNRWFDELKPKNEKHLLRYKNWQKCGPVAQLG